MNKHFLFPYPITDWPHAWSDQTDTDTDINIAMPFSQHGYNLTPVIYSNCGSSGLQMQTSLTDIIRHSCTYYS